jgi:NAD(P)-dependent dehydrogenase (short-subunit alcohol dehydrogenase family)
MIGKVAIVTGGGSGIGEQTSLLLAERGARVVVVTSTAATAAPVVAAIRAAGGEAIEASGDVADEATAAAAVAAALASWGRVDILINNAAITSAAFLARDTNVTEMSADVWARTMAVNLIGPAMFCKHAIPAMIAGGGGSVVMVSSGRGVQGDLGLTAYGASKAALINLALNVATQYGKQGIRANSVVVGMVMTPSVANATTAEMQATLRGHHLTPDIGQPRDVAEVLAFLASDAARFVTGATLAADGGITAHTAPYADFIAMSAGDGMIKKDVVPVTA